MKNNATTIGLDIAKEVFFVVGNDARGNEVLKRKLSRSQVLSFFAQLPPAKIGLEACSTAHYWARRLNEFGHEARLIAGQHVSCRVLGNKNDYRDAKVIAELRAHPQTLYVPINSEHPQDIQMLHRIRTRVKDDRIALVLQVRSLLAEYGISAGAGVGALLKRWTAVLGGEHPGLSSRALGSFTELHSRYLYLTGQLAHYDACLKQVAAEEARAKALMAVPGVGPLTATACLAALGEAQHFATGRNFAANLGLTPKEYSSGGKQRLFGISKRGDRYLRMLLIHGARSALRCAEGKPDRMLQWAMKLRAAKGFNVAACALANKMARILWAMLAHGREYQAQWARSVPSPAPAP